MYSVSVLLLGPYRPSRLENGYNAKAIAPHLTLFCVASFQGVPKGYQMFAAANEIVAPRTRRNTEPQKNGSARALVKGGSPQTYGLPKRLDEGHSVTRLIMGDYVLQVTGTFRKARSKGQERAKSVKHRKSCRAHSTGSHKCPKIRRSGMYTRLEQSG
jgi:hypothetical protein